MEQIREMARELLASIYGVPNEPKDARDAAIARHPESGVHVRLAENALRTITAKERAAMVLRVNQVGERLLAAIPRETPGAHDKRRFVREMVAAVVEAVQNRDPLAAAEAAEVATLAGKHDLAQYLAEGGA